MTSGVLLSTFPNPSTTFNIYDPVNKELPLNIRKLFPSALLEFRKN